MQSISSITSSAPLLLFSEKASETLVDTLFFTSTVQMQVPVNPISTLNGIDTFSIDGDKLGIDERTGEGTELGIKLGRADGSDDGYWLGLTLGEALGSVLG